MVVLVRCLDDSFAPALESNLNDLISKGLISAFLSNGSWIDIVRKRDEACEAPAPKRVMRAKSLAACY